MGREVGREELRPAWTARARIDDALPGVAVATHEKNLVAARHELSSGDGPKPTAAACDDEEAICMRAHASALCHARYDVNWIGMSEYFDARERAAWGGLVTAQGRIFRKVEADLGARTGLAHAEFEVLLRLSRAPDRRMRIQDLAAESLLTHSGTSRVVDRLAKKGHVRRDRADEDGRGACAVLTERGLDTFRRAAEGHVALVRREFLSLYSAEELEQLSALLHRVR